MLEREVHPEEQPTDAARVRVKPDELARAIAAVQSRKEAEARYLAETVAIGETVQDLGLDLTPEEVLAEIEAQRGETRADPVPLCETLLPVVETRTPTNGTLLSTLLLVAVGGGVLASLGGVVSYRSASQDVQPATLSPPPPLYSSPFHYGPAATGLPEAGPLLSSTSFPDGRPFRCNPRAIGPLLLEYPRHAYAVTPADHRIEGAWTLIKHGGRLYVRGWIARDALRQGRGTLTLFNYENAPELGARPVRITLAARDITVEGVYWRLGPPNDSGVFDDVHIAPGGQAESVPQTWRQEAQIRLSDFRLDGHATEKW